MRLIGFVECCNGSGVGKSEQEDDPEGKWSKEIDDEVVLIEIARQLQKDEKKLRYSGVVDEKKLVHEVESWYIYRCK